MWELEPLTQEEISKMTSPEPQKHREFWIDHTNVENNDDILTMAPTNFIDEYTHVIEYSALASRDEEIRKLRLANARSVDAAFHALLEMSAWMGIPEKKRHSMIEQLMENVRFCADVNNQSLTQTEGGDDDCVACETDGDDQAWKNAGCPAHNCKIEQTKRG